MGTCALRVCFSFFHVLSDDLLGVVKDKEGYLQKQIGNPDGEDKPNKKFYDPRVWVRKASSQL